MKAVIVEDVGKLAVKDVPEPEPLADEVVVQVAACGICGSDVRYLHGDNPWASQTLGQQLPNPPKMALGHEFAGTIAAVGAQVDTGRIRERVGVLAYRGCGRCRYCRTGRHNLCGDVEHIGHAAGWAPGKLNPAGMAKLCRVWAAMAYPLPDAISSEEACLLDGLAVAIHACDTGRVRRGDHALVLGSGAVGLLIAQVAKLGGATRVACVDTCAKPLEVAEQLGADDCRLIACAADCEPWRDRFDVVFDTVGHADTVVESLRLLRRGGRAVLMAHPSAEVRIDTRWLSGERSLLTSANSPYPDYPAAIELVATGRVQAAPLITHEFPIERAAEAFAVAEAKERHGAIKVLIRPA